MAILNVGKVGLFGKAYTSLEDALVDAIDGDIIQINTPQIKMDKPITTMQSGVKIMGNPQKQPVTIEAPQRQVGFYFANGETGVEFENVVFAVPEQSNAIAFVRGGGLKMTKCTIIHLGGLDERVIRPSVSFTAPNQSVPGQLILNQTTIDLLTFQGTEIVMNQSNIGNLFAANRFSNKTISVISAPQIMATKTAFQHIGFVGSQYKTLAHFDSCYFGGNVIISRSSTLNQPILSPYVAINQNVNFFQYPANTGMMPGLIASGNGVNVEVNHGTIVEHFNPNDQGNFFAQNYNMITQRVGNILPYSPLQLTNSANLTLKNMQIPMTTANNIAVKGSLAMDHVDDRSLWQIDNPKDVKLSNRNSTSQLFQDSLQNSVQPNDPDNDKKHETAMQKLSDLIGLDQPGGPKEKIQSFVASFQMQQRRNQLSGSNDAMTHSCMHMVFSGYAGTGKAQPLTTKLPTPNGLKQLGDLQVGDVVFGRKGQSEKITKIFDRGMKSAYKVVLADGRSTIVNDDHIFHVYKDMASHHGTDEAVHKFMKRVNDYHQFVAIDANERVQFNQKKPLVGDSDDRLPLPSLFLLALINSIKPVDKISLKTKLAFKPLTSEVADYVQTWFGKYHFKTNGDYQLAKIHSPLTEFQLMNEQDHNRVMTLDDLLIVVNKIMKYSGRQLDLMFAGKLLQLEKPINHRGLFDQYVFSNEVERQEIISYAIQLGLLKQRHNRVLLRQLQDLGCSLGYYTMLNANGLTMRPYKDNEARLIQIKSIVKLNKQVPMRCIYVDDPEHLYLTNDYIVTHNTTVAKLFGQALYERGVLKTSKFIEVTAKDLIGAHVGETDQKTEKVIESALDGVLFIDEAYELSPDQNGGGNSFKDEAVATLVEDAWKYRDRLVIIMAGYTNEMHDFFKRGNPGLNSRFPNWVEFPPYTKSQLKQIMQYDIRKNKVIVADPQTTLLINRGIDHLMPMQTQNSGQARFIGNLLDYFKQARDVRLSQKLEQDPSFQHKLTARDLNMITHDDVENGIEMAERRIKQLQ